MNASLRIPRNESARGEFVPMTPSNMNPRTALNASTTWLDGCVSMDATRRI
jgi:hypothetical protein